MTQDSFYSRLSNSISNDLKGPYLRFSPPSVTEMHATYVWNIALCESLYPALQVFELVLRNRVHTAAMRHFGSENWFRGILKPQEEGMINNTCHRIDPSGEKSINAAEIVGDLSLGFWVNLFKGRYQRILWPQLLRSVFPHATKRQYTREPLYLRLNRIRRLRNRVFHHEPIWHLPDLEEQHGRILETIGWISPAMLAMTRLLDRFGSVYTRGSQPYATELESIAQNWSA